MVNEFKKGLFCLVALYVCERGGEALENQQVAKMLAYSACAVCGSLIVKDSLEKVLPIVGTGIKNTARNLKKRIT